MNPRDQAVDFLENLLTFFGLNVSVDAREDDDEGVLLLNVPSTHLNGFLIGQRGENLRSLQHLTNMALKRNGFETVSVTVDIAGYKKQRNERLTHQVQQLAKTVAATGEQHVMTPMSAYERRIVHQAIGDIEGLTTASQGEGRDRHVIISKIAQ